MVSETLTNKYQTRWNRRRKSLTLALTNLLEGWIRGPQGQQPLLERFLLRAHQSWPILRGQPFWLHLFQESTWRNSDQTPNRRPTESFFRFLELNHWPAACILTIGRNHHTQQNKTKRKRKTTVFQTMILWKVFERLIRAFNLWSSWM